MPKYQKIGEILKELEENHNKASGNNSKRKKARKTDQMKIDSPPFK